MGSGEEVVGGGLCCLVIQRRLRIRDIMYRVKLKILCSLNGTSLGYGEESIKYLGSNREPRKEKVSRRNK